MGPGRMMATSTMRSASVRGWVRGSACICARLSTWNTRTVSPVGGAGESGQLGLQLVRARVPRLLGNVVQLHGRQAERHADVAHRALQLVGREGADQRRPVTVGSKDPL